MTNRRIILLLLITTALGTQAFPVCADDKSDVTRKKLAVRKAAAASLDPTQEKLAIAFAKEHHPELAALILQLQKKSPVEFRRGIREIHQAAVRLNRTKEKQPERFEADLKTWQMDSELRLLSAKWILTGNKKLEQQVRDLLRQRQENRLSRMKSERDRLAARLQQLDEQINMGTEELDAALTSEWERLQKRAEIARKARRSRKNLATSKTKPARKTAPSKSASSQGASKKTTPAKSP